MRRTYSLPLLRFLGIVLPLLLRIILLGVLVLRVVRILTLLRLLVLVAVLVVLPILLILRFAHTKILPASRSRTAEEHYKAKRHSHPSSIDILAVSFVACM